MPRRTTPRTEGEIDRFGPELAAWLHGELDRARAAEVRRHLEDCSECRRAVAELRAVSARLRALTTVATPAANFEAVHRRVRRLEIEETRFVRALKGVAAAAAAVLLVSATAYVWTGPSSRGAEYSDPVLERDTAMTLALSDPRQEDL